MVKRWYCSWLCALVLSLFAPAAQAVIEIRHPVTDPEHYLSVFEHDALSSSLVAHRSRTQVQIAVVLVRSTDGQPIEDYAHEMATRWGGGERGQDRGVLVLFAIGDRRSRIELGYGLESQITDSDARRMLDDVRPQLRESAYAIAAATVVDGILTRTGGTPGTVELVRLAQATRGGQERGDGIYTQPMPEKDYTFHVLLAVVGLLLGCVLFVLYLMRSDPESYSVSSGGAFRGGPAPRTYDPYGPTSQSYGSAHTSTHHTHPSPSHSFGSSHSSSGSSGSSSSSSGSSYSPTGASSTNWSGGGGSFGGGGASSSW